ASAGAAVVESGVAGVVLSVAAGASIGAAGAISAAGVSSAGISSAAFSPQATTATTAAASMNFRNFSTCGLALGLAHGSRNAITLRPAPDNKLGGGRNLSIGSRES